MCRQQGRFPLILAGNCISAVGTVAAFRRPEVYWFDAHGDLNTPESTRSGYLDGMALSILMGRCWRGLSAQIGLQPVPEEQIWLLGARDLDPAEEEFLAKSAVRRISAEVALSALPEVEHGNGAYLHIDLDVMDSSVGTANRYAAPGGFSLEGLVTVVERIAERTPIGAAALTAYDPEADGSGSVLRAALQIAERVAAVAWRKKPRIY